MSIKLTDLTLREKIGQTVVVQASSIINMESEGKMVDYVRRNPVGIWHTCNNCMVAANLEGLICDEPQDSTFYREWTQRYKKCHKVTPFIALDTPGRSCATDIPSLPHVGQVGAVGTDAAAYDYGKYMAMLAKCLGANWVWGSEVDMPSRFNSVEICRQFSQNLDDLVRMTSQSVRGGQDLGVVMTAKHFPGNDKKEYRDPHFCPTVIKDSLEVWRDGQAKAFKGLIENGVLSVMIRHNAFPAADRTKYGDLYCPSTISHNVITGLLKEELGFEGVVVSDAIDMGGLKSIFSNKEDLYAALLNAGIDVVLGAELDYVDVVEAAVEKGKISQERIDDACSRILKVKEKMGILEESEEVAMSEELQKDIAAYCSHVAQNSLCLQCDKQNLLPLDPEKIKSVAILCFTHSAGFFGDLQNMKAEFEQRGIKVRLQRRIESYEQMSEIAAENDLIIYASFIAPHNPMGGCGLFGDECRALFFAHSAGKEKSLGVSMGSPYVYYDYFFNMDTYIHTLGTPKETQKAFVQAIFGEIPFNGVYPYEKPWEEEI